jgi:hypothetical protein
LKNPELETRVCLGFSGFFFFNSSGQIEKPDPFKTRLKPVSVLKTRSETLLRKRGGAGRVFWDGAGRVPAGSGFVAIPKSKCIDYLLLWLLFLFIRMLLKERKNNE